MSKTIYLYLKKHNKTGLKYLGKTVQDPFDYRGSGLVWNRHLDKHGDDVSTVILFETEDMDEFKRVALEYSEKWNITESKEFANLIPEYGTGGDTSMCFTEESIEKIRTSLAKTREGMDLSRSDETKRKISESLMGHSYTEASRQKMSESAKNRGFIEGTGFQKGQEPHNKGANGFMSDRIWVNNGVISQRVNPNEIPDGFSKGRHNRHNFELFAKCTCPHCHKEGQITVMKRWHFDNCKERL